MPTRRELLARSMGVASLLAAAGLLPEVAQAAYAQAAFDAQSLADLARALGVSAPVEHKGVTLNAPDMAENGAVVPVGCACSLPGLRRLLIAVEKNPSTLCAVFDLVSDLVEPSLNTRIKMAQSSLVYAVAILADGRVLFAQKDVKVTLGGCGA